MVWNFPVHRNTSPAAPSYNMKLLRITNPSLRTCICNIWMWRRLSSCSRVGYHTDYGPSTHTDCILSCRHRKLDRRRARKPDVTLTTGGCRFDFSYTLLRHHNVRMALPTLPSCYMVVSFLLLDVTISCEPMNVSEANRQLLRHLAFNLHYLRLFGIELKPGVGLNFTVEQGWVKLATT